MFESAGRGGLVSLVLVFAVGGLGCDEAKKLVSGERKAPAVEQGKAKLYALYRKQVASVGQIGAGWA